MRDICKRLHSYWRMINKREVGVLLLVVAVVAVCSLSLVYRQDGWPQNHEEVSFFYRTQVYALHFVQGDIFPIWSSTDVNGYGTPSIFFYHKAFYYVSAIIFLVTGGLKFSIVAALFLWMALGGVGMYLCAKSINRNRLVALSATIIFLLANYTFVDWLVRGAMAEFSAMMLVPYVLWWCISLIKEGKVRIWIAPLLLLMWFAHNVITIILVPVVAAAYLLGVKRHVRLRYISSHKPILVALAICALCMIPYLAIYYTYSPNYSPSSLITKEGFTPADNMISPERYLFDSQSVWLRSKFDFPLQIDVALTGVIACGLIAEIVKGAAHKRNKYDTMVVFFATVLVIAMLLQLRIATSLYEMVPVLQLMQFPWRLLTLALPICIVLYVVSLKTIEDSIAKGAQVCAAIVCCSIVVTIVSGPLLRQFQSAFIPSQLVNSAPSKEEKFVSTIGIGEYLPITAKKTGEKMELSELRTRYIKNLFPAQTNCAIRDITGYIEATVRRYEVECTRDSQIVSLPYNYSSFVRVEQEGVGKIDFWSLPTDARIKIRLSRTRAVIRVYEPRLWSLWYDKNK